jgi:hypothetical protein
MDNVITSELVETKVRPIKENDDKQGSGRNEVDSRKSMMESINEHSKGWMRHTT